MSERGLGEMYSALEKVAPDMVSAVRILFASFGESGIFAQMQGESKPDQRRAIDALMKNAKDPLHFASDVKELLNNRDAFSLAVEIFNSGHGSKNVRALSSDDYKNGIRNAMVEFARHNGIDIDFGE